MSKEPEFERVVDHEFKLKETVFMIDPNGYDIWEGQITSIEGLKFSIHYPDYPNDDEVVEGTERMLVATKMNRRIFNNQEAKRSEILPALSSGEEPFDDEDDEDDEGTDYRPAAPGFGKEKGKKKKKSKDSRSKSKSRPEGARSNPPRGSKKNE